MITKKFIVSILTIALLMKMDFPYAADNAKKIVANSKTGKEIRRMESNALPATGKLQAIDIRVD